MTAEVYRSEVEIDAPAHIVWDVLVDLPAYPRWNPFTIEAVSTLEVGAPVDLRVRMLEHGRLVVRQREIVRAVRPPERLVWGATMLLGAIRAERVQTLEPLPAGRCRYRTVDTLEGPLRHVVALALGRSLRVGFDAMSRALAAEAERRHAP